MEEWSDDPTYHKLTRYHGATSRSFDVAKNIIYLYDPKEERKENVLFIDALTHLVYDYIRYTYYGKRPHK